MVNQIEGMRSQIEALDRVTADPAVRKAAEEVNQQLMATEMNLFDLRLTGGQDGVRYASKLLGKINYLANGLAERRLQADRSATGSAEADCRRR